MKIVALKIKNYRVFQELEVKNILRYKRGEHGKPFHFLEFQLGKDYAKLFCI